MTCTPFCIVAESLFTTVLRTFYTFQEISCVAVVWFHSCTFSFTPTVLSLFTVDVHVLFNGKTNMITWMKLWTCIYILIAPVHSSVGLLSVCRFRLLRFLFPQQHKTVTRHRCLTIAMSHLVLLPVMSEPITSLALFSVDLVLKTVKWAESIASFC